MQELKDELKMFIVAGKLYFLPVSVVYVLKLQSDIHLRLVPTL